MENERKMSDSGRFRKKQNTTASGPGTLQYLIKESENHTAFIKQLINTSIDYAINLRKVWNDTLAILCQKRQ